ncbi:MAG: EamA family transporter [Dehalococcoidia bacterium]|nr:EamA family transporter [Dehalococcoidia bacterium]
MIETAEAASEARRRAILGVIFGFSAALAYGVSQVLARHTVSDIAPPLVGSCLALFWGTLGCALMASRTRGAPIQDFRRGVFLFAAGGIFSAMGVTGLFIALERAPVVIVSPISSTNPLFTLVLAAIFLRDVEQLSPRVVIGAMLVVAGVVVLTVA